MSRSRKWGKRLVRTAARHPLASLLLALFLLFAASVLVLFLTHEATTVREALSLVLPPFLGEGPVNPALPLGTAVISFIGLLASIGSLAVVTAVIVNRFIKLCLRGGKVTRRTNESDHVVICGWNTQGNRIAEELEKADPCPGLVILAELAQRPVASEEFDFVCGDPTQDADLRRAGVQRAQSVIILTDFSSNPNEADGRALLIALAVETLNPHVRTCVQVLNSANRRHFERAGVDEIICLDQIGGNLAVASALNPGLSHVVSELLTFNSGSEFYRFGGKAVQTLAGHTYKEAVQLLAEKGAVLIGVETDDSAELRESLGSDVVYATKAADGRAIVVNPQGEYRIQASDALYCVSETSKVW